MLNGPVHLTLRQQSTNNFSERQCIGSLVFYIMRIRASAFNYLKSKFRKRVKCKHLEQLSETEISNERSLCSCLPWFFLLWLKAIFMFIINPTITTRTSLARLKEPIWAEIDSSRRLKLIVHYTKRKVTGSQDSI